MKSQLTIKQLEEFLSEIQNAKSDTLGYMLESAKTLLAKHPDEENQKKTQEIIQKIEARYIPLREREILLEPEYY